MAKKQWLPQAARAYRNLNNGRWSIQQRIEGKWVVIGHAASVWLYSVTVHQSDAGRDRARRDGVRNVHCMAEGLLHRVSEFTPLNGRTYTASQVADFPPCHSHNQITYNPFTDQTLRFALSGEDYTGSNYAHFADTQKMYINGEY